MIEEIRGFMSSNAKGRGQKPIVVGTSSIEMGVNFPISMLFTEGSEGTSLIQKIGRLGRSPSDEIAEAHLLVPPKVYEQLLEFNGKEVERSYFREKIIQAYPKFEDFWSYVRIFGLYENEFLIEQLAEYNAKQFPKNWHRTGSRQKEWFRKNLLPKLAMAYEIDNYEEHLNKLRTLLQKKHFDEKWIKRTLKSTRGETIPIACAIYDRADVRRGYFPFKTYDIRLVLSRGDIISFDSWEIYKSKSREIPTWYAKILKKWRNKFPNEWEEHQQEINVGNVEIFFEIDGLKEQPRSVEYMVEGKNSFLRSREFYILLVSLNSQYMDLSLNYTVSNVLKDIQISTFIIQMGNRQGLLKLKENLPPLFELSTLWQRNYSFQVAFGINALYLWSRELEQSGIFKNDS